MREHTCRFNYLVNVRLLIYGGLGVASGKSLLAGADSLDRILADKLIDNRNHRGRIQAAAETRTNRNIANQTQTHGVGKQFKKSLRTVGDFFSRERGNVVINFKIPITVKPVSTSRVNQQVMSRR